MNHTTNLNLPQFEETDRIRHDDFNGASEQAELFVFGNRAKFSSTVAPYYSGGTLMFDFEHTATGIILKSNPNWSVSVIMNTSGKHYSYFAIG